MPIDVPDDSTPLDAREIRVLGSLIEKKITTPEYYPMTLNALVNACNQRSNRNPVVVYGEDEVRDVLDRLRARKLASKLVGDVGRVPKNQEEFTAAYRLSLAETAVMCVLMLRGPQTLGEMRGRCERMYDFESLEEVGATLEALSRREPAPLVRLLPRRPGQKEARYMQLLGGDAPIPEEEPSPALEAAVDAPHGGAAASETGAAERIEALEAQVADLSERLAGLRKEFDAFRKQFD